MIYLSLSEIFSEAFLLMRLKVYDIQREQKENTSLFNALYM